MSSEPDDFGGEPSDGSASRVGSSILSVLWRRKVLVAFGGVVGMLLGILVYAQRPPVYQTTAQVMVIKKQVNNGPQPGIQMATFVEDYVASHLVVIRSSLIVEGAVQKNNLQLLPSFSGQDPTGAILSALVAARDARDSTSGPNNIINLSYRGGVAEDCPKVLTAVIKSYKDFLNTAYQTVTSEAVSSLQEQERNIKKTLEDKKKALALFHNQNKEFTPEGIIIQKKVYQNLAERLSELQTRRERNVARLESFAAQMQAGASEEQILLSLPPTEQPETQRTAPVSQPLWDRWIQLQTQLAGLSSGKGYGSAHPEVQAIQRQLEVIEEGMAQQGINPHSSDQKAIVWNSPLAKERSRIGLELQVIGQEEKVIDVRYPDAKKKADSIHAFELEEKRLEDEVKTLTTDHVDITKRLQAAEQQRNSGGFEAQVLGPPGQGGKVSPNLYQFLLGGILLGLMAGLGAAYLLEAADKGFRTPEEIRRQLGLPVIGHIPVLTPDEEAAAKQAGGQLVPDPLLCCYYKPRSVEAEAYRAVRTALYFSVDGEGHKVIQVTSPNQGDGKSTLAGNLAIAIAQSGKKVLLVDADCRRPRQHKVFGQAPITGLANVLSGVGDLDSAILPTAVEGLSILPCGPLPPNPAELLTSPRFPALLAELRQRYEFVLVDTPPLLAVTDPCVVAARVDGVVMTISMSRKARPQALRAREILATLGAKVLGVVVNRLERESGSGYQAQSYGGYGYGYSYEYTSSDSQPELPTTGTVVPPAKEEEV